MFLVRTVGTSKYLPHKCECSVIIKAYLKTAHSAYHSWVVAIETEGRTNV